MKPRPLAIASAGAFVAALSTSLVAVSAPVIAKDLSATPADVSWVLSAYLLAITCLLALAGRAADLLGHKRVYLAGFSAFVAGSAACAFAPSLGVLVGARVLQGVGSAMLMAVGPALVTRSAPPGQRARRLGVQLAATYLGLMLGPGLGGMLAGRFGYSAVFVVVAGAGALAATLAILLLPEDARTSARRPPLDLGGASLLAAGLGTLIVALKGGSEGEWASPAVIALAAASLLALGSFLRHEARHPAPLLPLRLLASPPWSLGMLGATLLYAVTFMQSYLLPFELVDVAGLTPAKAGAFLTAQPAVMAIVAPLSGALADRWGPRAPTTAGMAVMGLGLAFAATLASTPDGRLVAALAAVGLGSGLYVAPNNALIMGAAPRELQGTAGAMAATARNLGMTIGIAAAASLHRAVGFERSVHVAAALAGMGALLGLFRPLAARA